MAMDDSGIALPEVLSNIAMGDAYSLSSGFDQITAPSSQTTLVCNCSSCCGLVALPFSGATTFIAPPQAFTDLKALSNDGTISIPGPQSNLVTVTYAGFTPAAQTAFQYAVDIWNSLIATPRPLVINANFANLGPGVLGSAGPSLISGFSGQPIANNWYPQGLANQIADTDFAGDEIDASFSNTFGFYFGTDGNAGSQYDFVSVVLHEIGHGLGFVAGFDYNNKGTPSTNDDTATNLFSTLKVAFARPYENAAGQKLTDAFTDGTNALALQYISDNVFYNSPGSVAANGGTRPKMYAPTTYEPGSSISHLNDATYPQGNVNSLMTHAIAAGEVIHNPGPVTLAMFEDLGWGRVRTGARGARDLLIGTPNRDIITGGVGADTLTGGSGKDRFSYSSVRDAGDTITDFLSNSDQIDMRGLATSLGQTGINLISQGYISFVAAGSNTTILLDQDAAGSTYIARPFLTVTGIAPAALNVAANFLF